MLDLVPLARTGREVTHGDRQAGLLSKLLKLPLPQTDARAVAPTTICRDEERTCSGIDGRAHLLPPPLDRAHGKGRCVVVDSNRHPARVAREIVDPVRDPFAQLGNYEIVDPNRLRVSRTSCSAPRWIRGGCAPGRAARREAFSVSL